MPGADPITAVANAVEAILDDVVKPLLNEDLAQKYDRTCTNTIEQIQSALGLADPDRARAVGALASRLCIDNGHPAVGLGDDISIPVDYLGDLLAIAAERRRDNAKANELLHALTTK